MDKSEREERAFEELTERFLQLSTEHYQEMGAMVDHLATGGETIILRLVAEKPGEIYASDLSRITGLTAGRVANILRQLERKDIVVRRQDQENRRKYRIYLTDRGRRILQKQESAARLDHGMALRELGLEDAQELYRILVRCVDIFGAFRAGKKSGMTAEKS